MNHSNSIGKLAAAMVAAQMEMEHAHKDGENPHFGNTFASLPVVIDATRPILNKHGLAVIQLPGFEDGVATVETILAHESGEWLSGVSGAPIQKQDPQGVGSALTYLRRYSLAALCNIGQDDDDGTAAGRKPTEKPAEEPTKKTPTVTEAKRVATELKKLLAGGAMLPADGLTRCRASFAGGDTDSMKKAITWIKEQAA